MWWRKLATVVPTKKAVAYYRHSAQDRQEQSIPIQREQVRKFAEENGIEIVREFADHGKSGLSTEGRDDFNEMLGEYVIGGKEEFDHVLVLDVSRWGRFQDIDLSAYYTGLCQNYGKQVIYTSIGFPKENDLLYYLHLNIERYRAASYSRELSGKVFKGCARVAEQGFRAGGTPPYGLHRLLLDEQRRPVQVLEPGQRKSIQNQRVTLGPGDEFEVSIVQRIFADFVRRHRSTRDIAAALNDEGVPSPGGKKWRDGAVRTILRNELYTGTMVYNKTRQRLQSASKKNPPEEWVRKEGAFKAIVDRKLFSEAQRIFQLERAERRRKYSPEDMLAKLARLRERCGKAGPRQIAADREMVSASTYAKHFMSLDRAYQNLYGDVLDRTRQSVIDELRTEARQVEEYDDYVVLNDSFSLLVQPSVPIAHGYDAYWAFRPDPRKEVDITLGVALSNSGRYDILGYLALPRMFVESRNVKVFSSTQGRLELHGYRNLDMIKALLD